MGTKSLAIIKLSALGDVVQALHSLAKVPLAEEYSKITWICESASAPLVALCPGIHRVISIDLKQWKKISFWRGDKRETKPFHEILSTVQRLRLEQYDTVLDLQGNIKSALVSRLMRSRDRVGMPKAMLREKPAALFYHRSLVEMPKKKQQASVRENLAYFARSLLSSKNHISADLSTKNSPHWVPELNRLSTSMRQEVDHDLQQGQQKSAKSLNNVDQIFLIAPSSAWSSKELSADMIALFTKTYLRRWPNARGYLLWGNAVEKIKAERLCAVINRSLPAVSHLAPLSKSYRLDALAYLMSKMHLVVSCDSLALHLAHWVGCRVFAFFGPTSANYYGKISGTTAGNATWQGTCPYGVLFEQRCPVLRRCLKAPCMQHLPHEEVEHKIAAFVKSL